MAQILIVIKDKGLSTLLRGKITQKYGEEVIVRNSASEAISLLEILPDIEIILCNDFMENVSVAGKICDFLKARKEDNPQEVNVVVMGKSAPAYPKTTYIGENPRPQKCVDFIGFLLGKEETNVVLEDEKIERERAEIERIEKEKERIENEKEREKAEIERIEKEKIEKEKAEREKIEKEKIERERLEREKAEKERLVKEKLEKEKAMQERLERGRARAEKIEQEKIEKEKAEIERVEKEKLEKENTEKGKIEKEKAAKEKAERERIENENALKEKTERDRLEKENAEKERLEREKVERGKAIAARMEQVRLEKEKLEKEKPEKEKAEKEKLEKEKIEKENARIERENAAQERIARGNARAEKIEKEKTEKAEKEILEKSEKERLEKAEKERLEKEKVAKAKAEIAKAIHRSAEKERVEQERIEQERIEQERIEKEKADNEKTTVFQLPRNVRPVMTQVPEDSSIVHEYFPMNAVYFTNLTEVTIDFSVYTRIKKLDAFEYHKKFSSNSKLTRSEIERVLLRSGKELYITKDELKKAGAFLNGLFLERFKKPDLNWSDRMKLNSDSFEILLDLFKNSSFDKYNVEIIKELIKSIDIQVKDPNGIALFLEAYHASKLSYGYTHLYLTFYFLLQVVDSFPWGSDHSKNKLLYLTLFHDLNLNSDRLIKLHHNYLQEIKILTDEDKQIILVHAEASANVLEGIIKAPLELTTLIKEHHGVKAGKGFMGSLNVSVAPTSIAFIVIEDFVTKYLENLERLESDKDSRPSKSQLELIFTELKKRYDRLTYADVLAKLQNLKVYY